MGFGDDLATPNLAGGFFANEGRDVLSWDDLERLHFDALLSQLKVFGFERGASRHLVSGARETQTGPVAAWITG